MKKRTLLIATLTVLALAISGCADNNSSSNTTRLEQTSDSGSVQMEAAAPVGAESSVASQTAEPPASTVSAVSADTASASETTAENGITEDKAKEIALADAGVAEADVTGLRVKKEKDKGRLVYEVDFYVGKEEHDYDIDASTGAVISKDMEIEDDFNDNNTTNSASASDVIGEAKATAIVLARVDGATEKDVYIKLDKDDGKQVYEGEIRYNGVEYEFELNAATGDILEWSQEPID